MTAGFKVIKGIPMKYATLHCMRCDKDILPKAPVGVEIQPDGISIVTLMGSAKCLTDHHSMVVNVE